jgi:hypothetical protein
MACRVSQHDHQDRIFGQALAKRKHLCMSHFLASCEVENLADIIA